ncbi:unnamed protein product [Vitrella brassicaformis CCMP3155]|uniref:Uncharacterized protein n=1 Tax=Vitrella brassicaformis (strain CCMP3155) TaxID=1169540 RepID=A0A0G4EB73_VITBC|nr:unnamed protein product [Vitrella brassicaformis CCMP3155]|eukprot:CEL93210.1 unnamed protein product [Vitrella brassicaformis CCMP3155]
MCQARVRQLVRANLQIKVVLMSATVDPAKFLSYFSDAHISTAYVDVPDNLIPRRTVEEFYLNTVLEDGTPFISKYASSM